MPLYSVFLLIHAKMYWTVWSMIDIQIGRHFIKKEFFGFRPLFIQLNAVSNFIQLKFPEFIQSNFNLHWQRPSVWNQFKYGRRMISDSLLSINVNKLNNNRIQRFCHYSFHRITQTNIRDVSQYPSAKKSKYSVFYCCGVIWLPKQPRKDR